MTHVSAPHPHRFPRLPSVLRPAALLLALLLAATTAAAQDEPALHSSVIDAGKLIVSQDGRPLRVEEFALQRFSDTLVVRAASQGFSEPGKPAHPVDKTSILIVGGLDYAMGSYWSTLAAGTDTLKRGITVSGRDTVYTEWRELNKVGTGEVKAMPPGRLYILDPPLFTTFSVLAHSLKDKMCDRRPIQVMVLGTPRDSIVAATVDDVGRDTLRWGGRPVVARKLRIADRRTTFTAWVALDGRLMRLEEPATALVVERQAAPVKRREPRPGR